MTSGLPVSVGAVQLTDRLVGEAAIPLTDGAAGAEGGSSTSVRLIVTVALPLSSPSEAITVTE